MKKILLTLAIAIAGYCSYAQTKTLTVDANDALNNNTKIVAQASVGQNFFMGHQLGTSYSYTDAIFRAWTDNPNGASNVFFNGIAGGVTNFSVRADGQGYFANNVGIGTTSPSNLLQVSSATIYTTLIAAVSAINNDIFGFRLQNTGIGGQDWRLEQGRSAQGAFDIFNGTTNATSLTVLPGGNVGIGTITPDTKLAVKGTIHTQEVKVDITGWSDYVFKPTYNLPSLSEVKTYIDKNQHLPDMPSEQDVISNGLNLGEMNKLLTKKVEELTLYAIDQQKQIELLKQQQEKSKQQQDARIATLETALSKLTTGSNK